ncbi:MAG: ATP-binding cassette domain-containing protein [Oscillospiraceae bacterium]|nr:ATP-binding cassette domain-containing protein [Oscillospiraceae bacterium]
MLQMKNVGLDGASGKKTVHILRRINLVLPDTGRILLTGSSGSGKTSLLRLMAGRELPSRGEIWVNGENTARWNDTQWSAYRRRTGTAGEELLLPDRTLRENAVFSARLGGWRGADAEQKASDALATLGISELSASLPDEISGEERRLGALCCALCREPDILLLDEPTDGLQESTAAMVLSVLRSEGERRLVVIASRHQELFFGESIHVITLSDGQIDTDTLAGKEPKHSTEKREYPAPGSLSLALGNLHRRSSRLTPRLLTPFAAVLILALLFSILSGAESAQKSLQAQTLSGYPITLTGESIPSGDLDALADWLENRADPRKLTVQRSYAIQPTIYAADTGDDMQKVNPRPDTGASLWTELPEGEELRSTRYEMISGRWPQAMDEAVIILNAQGIMDQACVSALGISEEQVLRGMSYPELLQLVYRVVLPTEEYVKNVDGTWGYMGSDASFMQNLVKSSLSLKIVGIVQPGKELAVSAGVGGCAYTQALTEWVISSILQSDIVTEQLASPDRDVVSGLRFDTDGALDADHDAQLSTLERYALSLSAAEQAALAASLTGTEVDETAAQDTLLKTLAALDENRLSALYRERITAGAVSVSLEENLRSFGATAAETITAVQLYASSFAYRGTAASLLKSYTEPVSFSDIAGGVISSGAKLMDTTRQVFLPLRIMTAVLAAVAVLLVGLLAVLPRRREIAIWRCRGLSGSRSASVIGWESLLLGVLGSVAGALLALAVVTFLPADLLDFSPALSIQDTLILAGTCALLSWLAGRLSVLGVTSGSAGDALRLTEL